MKEFVKLYIDEFRSGKPSQKLSMIADVIAILGATTVLAFAQPILDRFLAVPLWVIIIIAIWILASIVSFLVVYGAYSKFISPLAKSMLMGKMIDSCLRAILTLAFVYGLTLLYKFIKVVHW